MLGPRTKQVNSYGKRGSRIVNVSERRGQESADSSDAPSDADTPFRLRPLGRENAIIISPEKHRAVPHRSKGSGYSQRSSPFARTRKVQPKAIPDVATRRIQPKLGSITHIRQPLTPLRANGIPSNKTPSEAKGEFKASTIKPKRTSLKPHVPVIAVDIIVVDKEGNMLTQERRLSHTESESNRAHTTAGKAQGVLRTSPHGPITVDSDLKVTSPKPVIKQRKRRHYPVVVSPAESEADNKETLQKNHAISLTKSYSSRVEVAIPPAPFRKPKVANKPLSPLPPSPAPSRLPAPPSAVSLHLLPPLPIPKPRQLTPIRGLSSRSVFRRPPLTPSTLSEADLSLELAQLDLSDAIGTDDLASAQPGYLLPLLIECAQTSPYEFSAFIETFPFDPIVQSSTMDNDARFRKIGEASYSEVFGIGSVVLKVIPVRFEDELTHPETVELPASSDAQDILKEILVTREVGGVCDKFVKLLKTYVVRGKYPSLLLGLWDEYNERKGSESIRPDSFGLTQVYAIIILPNGGPDLESYAFKNVSKSGWHQACGIFWQVARALEQAECLVNFEHRDLHWGQILVQSIPVEKPKDRCSTQRLAMDDTRFGVKVTIIDLGLSRMNAVDAEGSKSYWTAFDDEIFEGEGDYQYDIYRMMRDLVGSAWKSYHPFTNLMWLHYLVTKLLHEKRLKFPGGKRLTGGDTRVVSPTGYDEQECFNCLAKMEKLLGKCIASARSGQKSRRKTTALTSGPKSAGEVVAYGMRHGWVQ